MDGQSIGCMSTTDETLVLPMPVNVTGQGHQRELMAHESPGPKYSVNSFASNGGKADAPKFSFAPPSPETKTRLPNVESSRKGHRESWVSVINRDGVLVMPASPAPPHTNVTPNKSRAHKRNPITTPCPRAAAAPRSAPCLGTSIASDCVNRTTGDWQRPRGRASSACSSSRPSTRGKTWASSRPDRSTRRTTPSVPVDDSRRHQRAVAIHSPGQSATRQEGREREPELPQQLARGQRAQVRRRARDRHDAHGGRPARLRVLRRPALVLRDLLAQFQAQRRTGKTSIYGCMIDGNAQVLHLAHLYGCMDADESDAAACGRAPAHAEQRRGVRAEVRVPRRAALHARARQYRVVCRLTDNCTSL
ncbi:hypothetical protein FI667_g2541, partial [Globisporangium splendens]